MPEDDAVHNQPSTDDAITHDPVTYERCGHIEGTFYHGTKSVLAVGAELVPGHNFNFQQARVYNNIYFTTLVETAVRGAELATARPRARSTWPTSRSSGSKTSTSSTTEARQKEGQRRNVRE